MTMSRIGCRRVLVLIGGVLIEIVVGTSYTFANMNTYMTSYMRQTGVSRTLTYTECTWVYVVLVMCMSISMPLSSILEKRIGSRLTCFLGSIIIFLGTGLSYFTIQKSFAATLMTYGVMTGVGFGTVYLMPMVLAQRWMPKRPGLAYGIVNGGIGGGKLIFNIVQTWMINPNNLGPTAEVNGQRYFNAPEIMDRVPMAFLKIASIYAALQLIGCLLISEPPSKLFDQDNKGQFCKTEVGTDEIQEARKPLLTNSSPHTEHDQGEDRDITLKQLLKSSDFYKIYIINFSTTIAIIFLNSLYKAFGLSFISNDIFLSLVGTIAALFSFLGRLVWGIIGDCISFKVCAMVIITIVTSLLLTFPIVPLYKDGYREYVFLLYICLLYGTAPGFFTLIPSAIMKRFGEKNFTRNVGLGLTNQMIAAPLTSILSDTLQESFGWTYVFFTIASIYYIAFFPALLLKDRDYY